MKVWQKIVIATFCAALTAFLCGLPFVEGIDLSVSDQFKRLIGKKSPPSNIVVIAIDEPSYRELNVGFDKPWPRALHAKMLRRLKELGVSRVVFDILFTGPGSDPAVDQELIAAFSAIPSIIGVEAIKRSIAKQGGGIEIEELDQPYDEFRAVTTQALVNLDMNTRDGFIRTFPFANSDQTRRFQHLGFAAAGVKRENETDSPKPRDLINYYGSARQNARVVSYWEIFEKMAPAEEASFRDAIVFVGLLLRSDTGVAQKDSYLSPFGGDTIFGVEIHATIAANLLRKDWISRPSRWLEVALQAVVSASVALGAMMVSPVTLALIVLGLILAWAATALFSLANGLFVAGAFTALILLPAIVLIHAITSYMTARRSEEALRSAFSLYVSPDMVPKLQKEGDGLKLGGEKLWLTAMFTDIADFTTITEEMPAERTSEMLNAYFTEVMEVVFANQGTLLKFIGDAIFAIWGAPVVIQNHAELSIQTALAIQKGVERFNASQRFPPLATRIGIHTGPMLVGNLGSKRRFDYTAIGDSVNLASRVEGLNKYLGTSILFTEATRRDAGGLAGAVQIATVRVKGRRESVALFSIFDPPLEREVLADWGSALTQFSKGAMADAGKLFTQIEARERRLAKAARLYLEEIDRLSGATLEQGWDGALDFDV
ncbi:MAG: CHASE2 domain-containing protein, partial [Pseudomonadota bacterium]